jgi:hypothetical protein
MPLNERRALKPICTTILVVAVMVSFGLIGCNNGGGGSGGGEITITGTVANSVGSDTVVALFDETYWFSASVGDDTIDQETKGQTPPFTPLVVATINGGSYSVTLPQGSDGDNLFLLAWDDANQDQKFELSEHGVLPMKLFDQGTFPVEYLRYTVIMGFGEWSAYYFDGATVWLLGLSIAGTSGYNFTVD